MIFKILLPIVLFITVSCGKDEPTSRTTDSPPQISVSSPSANSQFTDSENLSIKANITDDKEINEISVSIKKMSDNTVFAYPTIHAHSGTYSVNLNYSVATTDSGNYQIIIEASDFNGNKTVKNIDVVLNP